MSCERYEIARLKYKPDKIDFLLVAESPPKCETNRFFYFEIVTEMDFLFIETMRVVYPELSKMKAPQIRGLKSELLKRFRSDGFYLIDASDSPLGDYNTNQKTAIIQKEQAQLLEKIRNLIDKSSNIILISAVVYKACFKYLNLSGVNIVNDKLLPFPSTGNQSKYKIELARILGKLGWGDGQYEDFVL